MSYFAIIRARTRIKEARKAIVIQTDERDKSEYEGYGMEIAFNKKKFFQDIGTTRLNELAKLYGVYDRNEHKAQRIQKMADLPNAQDIIFNEIFLAQYGSVSQMKAAIEQLPQKKKRGRPRKITP